MKSAGLTWFDLGAAAIERIAVQRDRVGGSHTDKGWESSDLFGETNGPRSTRGFASAREARR